MIIDNLSKFLTQLQNGSCSQRELVTVQFDQIAFAILRILKEHKIIENFEVFSLQDQILKFIKIKLVKTKNSKNFLKNFKISKPGRRIYSGYRTIQANLGPSLFLHDGIAILSTSSGILSHKKAIQLKKGGEILCFIRIK